MSVLTTLNLYVRRYRDIINRRRTERLIGSLPLEVRKDIGWPNHHRRLAPRLDGTRNNVWNH